MLQFKVISFYFQINSQRWFWEDLTWAFRKAYYLAQRWCWSAFRLHHHRNNWTSRSYLHSIVLSRRTHQPELLFRRNCNSNRYQSLIRLILICITDAKHAWHHLQDIGSTKKKNEAIQQIIFADRIVINKIDLVDSPQELQKLEETLKQINSVAPITKTTFSNLTISTILDIK